MLDHILEYRQLSKIKSTYVDALPTLVNPGTGRVHTSYNQTGSATGRISSNDPNVQNIPVRTELGRRVRKAFIAEGAPDWIGPSAIGHSELDRLEAEAYVEAFGTEAMGRAGLVSTTQQIGFAGPATSPLNLAAALLSASGEIQPHRAAPTTSGEGAREQLAAAMGRGGRVGAGSIVIGSSFSFDRVHAAVVFRIEA